MPFVYFIHEDRILDTFKIGKTENHPADRMDQLQTGNPRKLRLYRWIQIENHSTAEEYLHVVFHESHIRGEWFHITTDLIDEQCNIIAGNDEAAIVSGAWEPYTDDDRTRVKLERVRTGRYRGKIPVGEAREKRAAYMERQQAKKAINYTGFDRSTGFDPDQGTGFDRSTGFTL